LLTSIPGISATTAEVIVAETGADMSRFPTAGHLCAWAGVAPASYESAGKKRPAGTRCQRSSNPAVQRDGVQVIQHPGVHVIPHF
jgi:transposase